jgi:hypothetical protein
MRDWTIQHAGGPAALKAAVAAIYFNDSSDYESALWTVVRELCPEMVELLEANPSGAYHQADAFAAAGVAIPLPLSDEQIMQVWNSSGPWSNDEMDPIAFVRAVLAAHGVGDSDGT